MACKPSLMEMQGELQKLQNEKQELQDTMRREYQHLILLEATIDELLYKIHEEEEFF